MKNKLLKDFGPLSGVGFILLLASFVGIAAGLAFNMWLAVISGTSLYFSVLILAIGLFIEDLFGVPVYE